MSLERSENNCQAVRDELTRLVCGDVAEPSPALRSHLADCAACREHLGESRELVGALRAALRPELLPERLRTYVDARLDAQTVARPVMWPFPLRLACAAAAAGLLAAILMPWSGRGPAPGLGGRQTPAIVLSEKDTRVIGAVWAAWEFLGWESAAEYAVVYLSARIEDVTRTMERDPGANAVALGPGGRLGHARG